LSHPCGATDDDDDDPSSSSNFQPRHEWHPKFWLLRCRTKLRILMAITSFDLCGSLKLRAAMREKFGSEFRFADSDA
jgi:hypothetical protein